MIKLEDILHQLGTEKFFDEIAKGNIYCIGYFILIAGAIVAFLYLLARYAERNNQI